MSRFFNNSNAVRLRDPENRQAAYRLFCDHIASGNPRHSFSVRTESFSIAWSTMERLMRENPDEFDPTMMEEAMAKRYAYWLEEGKKLMTGKYKHGSPVVWQTCMRNIFKDIGWDKAELHGQIPVQLVEGFTQVMEFLGMQQKKREVGLAENLPIDTESGESERKEGGG
jgi:hypothetical protein